MKNAGFSLIEVLVATTIMIVALASLAHLFVLATEANTNAKTMSMALLLAEAKMEQLRSLVWGFDGSGLPLSDDMTDTSTVPASATGGTGLGPSPSNVLSVNMPGYVDYLDANGVSLGGMSTTSPAGAVYIRRWSIEPLSANPQNTLVLQVGVTRPGSGGTFDMAAGVTRRADEVRLISAKTRKLN